MVKLFLDSANTDEMEKWENKVQGFTTNPSLARKAKVKDYSSWAQTICLRFPKHSISFEVIADDFDEMEEQARKISRMNDNIHVKIPVTNTKGESSGHLIKRLTKAGIKVNVTAVFTRKQIDAVVRVLDKTTPSIISIFAGRIADTGKDPSEVVSYAARETYPYDNIEVLWASTRQVFDVYFPAGADIITVSADILKRMELEDKDLTDYSRETVKQFYDDAKAAGYTI